MEEYLLRFATPYQRYLVNNDLPGLMRSVEKAAKSMRTDFRIMTQELLQTDRAGLPATRDTIGAYSGALATWRDGLTPTMAVSWEAPDTDFAALVVARLGAEPSVEAIRVAAKKGLTILQKGAAGAMAQKLATLFFGAIGLTAEGTPEAVASSAAGEAEA